MSARIKRVPINDPSRFEGNGISYKAKLIGIEDVREARGDLMCQEAMTKLKNSVKISGEHKRKIFVNVTLEGLRIIDAISLIVLHIHPVHRISFISRDVTDTRAFGYVFGTEDGLHKFFAIKTAAAAENLVLTLRDLFQVVYEMKKKEVEAAKVKLENEVTTNVQKENLQTSGVGSTSGTGKTQTQKANVEPENIYQVPTNNAPISPVTHAEQVANLLDLEDQAEHILKGIEQIKNLEFDSVARDSFATPPISPLAKLSPSSSSSDDPWGVSPASTPNFASSLGDLTGLQPGAFASTHFPLQSGFAAPAHLNSASAGLPLTKDPFASDPFGSAAQQPRFPVSSAFAVASPFAPGFAQPYGMQAVPPRLGMMAATGMMVSPPVMGVMRSPYLVPQSPGFHMSNAFAEDANILQPMKKDGRQDASAVAPEPVKPASKTREQLFADLLNIKKSAPSTARSPKDMFAQMNAPERKPMNEMTTPGKHVQTPFPASAQSQPSQASCDPFGDVDSVTLDRTRGLLLSDAGEQDPFDTSFIPPLLAESSPHAHSSTAPSTPPPVPTRQPSSHNHISHVDAASSSPILSSPPPPTLSSHHTPPPPHRPHKSDTLKDINENISTFPWYIHTSHDSCLPPSPTEPPPPLPPHVFVEPAPASPSTPRPHVHSAQTVPGVRKAISEKADANFKDSNLSNTPSLTHTVFTDNVFESQRCLQERSSSDAGLDPASSQACANIVQTWNHVTSLPDPGQHTQHRVGSDKSDPGQHTQHRVGSDKSDWVAFEVLESPSAFICPALHTNADDCDDPFNVAVHLTPGFKAVAKFGTDPFDDCLNQPFSQDADEPFGVELSFPDTDSASSVHFPFGEPFKPAVPQAASKPLFD
ncbi:hypothetical protein BsWGS_03203 [Bradybaena similaris]